MKLSKSEVYLLNNTDLSEEEIGWLNHIIVAKLVIALTEKKIEIVISIAATFFLGFTLGYFIK